MEQGHSRGAHGVMWSTEARRGLSGQRNGDARRHAAVRFCNRSDYCSIDSEKNDQPDSVTLQCLIS